MSRAFVKEDGPEQPDQPWERPISPQPNYVTRRGQRLLEDQEASLRTEHAGLPADKTDPAVRKRKAEIERDLRYVRARLETAIPVDPISPAPVEIRFGARVRLQRRDGESRVLRIVGEDEAQAGGELVPWTGPFVQALFGLRPGQGLDWETEAGTQRWSVAAVDYPV
ncbi:MAG: GreA/GreB family elongation factor [Elusimicrobiota bacterium]|jgi:transcription elongation GreA/GreB family factor